MVAVNRALVRRFAGLAADPKATDATRLLWITGSEYVGGQRIVDILHIEQRDGKTTGATWSDSGRSVVPRPPVDWDTS